MSKGTSPETLDILRLTNSLYPDKMGGIPLHTHQMSKYQANLGHNVTVATSDNGDRELPAKEERAGYTIRRYRELVRPLDNSIPPKIVPDLWNEIENYDIVHAHSHLYFSTNISSFISTIKDTPLVITNHGLFSQTAPDWIQSVFLPLVARPTLNSSDLIFSYTEKSREMLRERDIQTPVEIIHNGIDCDYFNPDVKEQNENQILFVGRFKKGKGVDYLCDALPAIVAEYPDATVKLAGGGSLRDEFRQQCRKAGIADNVEFLGKVPNDEMPALYNESSLLVSPTLTEAAIPRVVMEAWACKTPVVMTDIPEADSDVVRKAGLEVPMESSDAIAENVIRLLDDDSLRKKLGEQGRDLVTEKYSWQETVERTTESYHDVLETCN
ncbi:glycosyltransferase family 4 protein [Halalkalicoccus tibetensis]|uniref:Glycosyltransferase family 4 protein n=1 Tax=Halalkalicoccus tibetensis TaxID=175632 RepID=A0ABD5V8E0_9EURY